MVQAPPSGAPLERIVFQTERVTIGAFRCPLEHPRFADSGPIAQHCFVFPRTAVAIEHEHAWPLVANPNVVTLYNRGQRYRRRAISSAGDRCDWFGVEAEIVREVLLRFDPAVADRPNELFPWPSGRSDAALYLSQRRIYEAAASGDQVDALAIEESVIELLERVAALSFGCPAPVLGPERHSASTREVERILSQRWNEDLRLADLAREVGISVYHLCHTFRRETGTTLHQYRHQLRLRASLEPVRQSTRPLLELALQLGFSSHSHFTSAFRREFGLTPSRTRSTSLRAP